MIVKQTYRCRGSFRLSLVAHLSQFWCREPISFVTQSHTSASLSSLINFTGKWNICQSSLIDCVWLLRFFDYRLCINYVEGESKFISISKDETFSLRAPPCCCCFACFKKSTITKYELHFWPMTSRLTFKCYFRRKFKILRFLVLQMAVVHVIIFLTLNLISIESPETVDNIMGFFVPFIAGTIILSVWAFQITIRAVVPYYANLNLLKKFLSFQLVLIFCKLQPVLLNFALQQVIVDCDGPFTIVVKIRGKLAIVLKSWKTINQSFLLCWSSNHANCHSSRNGDVIVMGTHAVQKLIIRIEI